MFHFVQHDTSSPIRQEIQWHKVEADLVDFVCILPIERAFYVTRSHKGVHRMQELTSCACSGKSLPKLVRPAVLFVLTKGTSHGYAIIEELKRLALCGDCPPDHTAVYRALQAMESEGLITSGWEHPQSGPAKRSYKLTPRGKTCLKKWKTTLRDYKRTIDMLLRSLS
jgi:DNA-binding PadR family transcriptional regulator